MKKESSFRMVRSLLLSIFMLAAVIILVKPVQAEAATVRQTGVTKTSADVAWDAPSYVSNLTNYKVYIDNNLIGTLPGTSRSARITGLKAGNEYRVIIKYDYQPSYSSQKYLDQYLGTCYVKTIPAQIARPKISDWYPSIKKVNLTWTKQSGADGYQYILENYQGQRKYTKYIRNPYSTLVTVGGIQKMVFRFKVRAYCKINGKTYWGAWSGYQYLVPQPGTLVLTDKYSSNKISFRFSKVKGASGYRIYISNQPKSGYKLAATLPASRNSYTIRSYNGKTINLKSGNYYILIRPYKKVGRLNAYSPAIEYYSIYRHLV